MASKNRKTGIGAVYRCLYRDLYRDLYRTDVSWQVQVATSPKLNCNCNWKCNCNPRHPTATATATSTATSTRKSGAPRSITPCIYCGCSCITPPSVVISIGFLLEATGLQLQFKGAPTPRPTTPTPGLDLCIAAPSQSHCSPIAVLSAVPSGPVSGLRYRQPRPLLHWQPPLGVPF